MRIARVDRGAGRCPCSCAAVQKGSRAAPALKPGHHAEVGVLLELERRAPPLDRAAEGVERAGAGVAGPGEDQLPGAAGGDHLVVDEIGREPAERQVAAALADDLVPRREADEVGEALDDDGVAVVDVRGDGVAHGGDLGAHGAQSQLGQPGVDHRQGGVDVLVVHDERRRQAERALAGAEQQQAALEKARCTSLLDQLGGGLARARGPSRTRPDHEPAAAHVADAARCLLREAPDAGQEPLAHARRRWP